MARKAGKALVWVISGAGRGVGKTTLARRLCDLLPGSVYAKYGRGRPRADKTPNYFQKLDDLAQFVGEARPSATHVVVECNAWAREGKGDVTVFIGAQPGRTGMRADAEVLRAAADLCVTADADPAQWRKALTRTALPAALRTKVVRALANHQRVVAGGAEVRTKVWFEAGGKRVFGTGIARLLAAIDQFGTLTAAAKDVSMSYRYAWQLLRTAEAHLGSALVSRQTGGASGGGTALTDHGRHALAVFQQLNRDVADFADARFSDLYERKTTDG